jgi:UDP-glucose 4-epimerase
VTGKKVPYQVGPRRAGDPAVLVGDASLARKELGWNPRYIDIEEIIAHAWNYYKRLLNKEI